jgi:hypothetical protein
MKLVSMKLDRAAREATVASTPDPASEGPVYPWGLSVSLEEDALDKLNLETLPDVDEVLQLVARVTVTSVASNQTTAGGRRRSVALQITDLGLGPEPSRRGKRDADTLYGDRAE